MKKLVLLLNMGGANDLDDVKVFLTNMFNDPYILGIKNGFVRKILASFIVKMRLRPAQENYKQIGGKSPICDLTQALCDKLNALEFSGEDKVKFDFAMNYTAPFTQDVLSRYADANEIVVLPLYPHHSVTTVSSSLDEFHRAYNALGLTAKVRTIEPFYKNKIFNTAIVDSIKREVRGIDISDVELVFSAHSLPQKTIDRGDLYEKHVREHVEIISEMLKQDEINFARIRLAYQSRLGPVKWLEPALGDVLADIPSKKAVIYPLSFCIDNSETTFELVKEFAHVARELGFEFYDVVPCLNDSDDFVNFIANMA